MDGEALGGNSRIVLIDNGSLNPKSVLEARALASELSERLGEAVDTVSVAHSDEIPESELGGTSAVLWKTYLEEADEQGICNVFVLPLFVGPGFALKKAKTLALKLQKGESRVDVRWANTLVSRSEEDALLVELLSENVIQALDTQEKQGPHPRVLLVDHGSPFEDVTKCRDYAADRLSESLRYQVESVVACSMERREGREFDFNEPSLKRALDEARSDGVATVVICHLFLFSGRHAGFGGDIDEICDRAGWGTDSGLAKTELIGSHPKVLELLEKRLNSIRHRG